jgi:hypothetical protein
MTVYTFSGFYTVDLVRAHPDKYFIFGDNTLGFGKGGQAIIRDEPNAIGIPTKWKPDNTPDAFFQAGDAEALKKVSAKIVAVQELIKNGHSVVWPVTADGHSSLGLGLARLNETAPDIYELIDGQLQLLTTEPL